MDTPCNPFLRGYYGFEVQRVAVISYDDSHPQTYLPLHPSQSHLPDEQVARRACIFSDNFVLVTEGQAIAPELDALCGGAGIVQTVLYGIHGDDDGSLVHIGDTYSLESTREIVHRLTFETGFYSRCWEISTAHLTQEAGRYLAEMADIATPTGSLFVAFRIPYSPVVGVKLIATPWTDANLQYVEEMTADQLRQEHRSTGMPQDLAELLMLAGRADVRILIFDADAPVLDGLPLYEV